jgi:hypothetical protein
MRPPFEDWDEVERQRRGFTRARMEALLGDEGHALLAPWLAEGTALREAITGDEAAADDLRQTSGNATVQALTGEQVVVLKEKVQVLVNAAKTADEAGRRYRIAGSAVAAALRTAIDHKSQLGEWQELVEITATRRELFDALVQVHARKEVAARLDRALAEIDNAKGAVLDEKFATLGADIDRWWQLLRPGEPVRFGGVGRPGTGRRFVDLKAKLLPGGDSTEPPKVRNAVAVFSDSQLNCLGLAAFLARTTREQTGFVILDDPVPASDEEHRAMFERLVIEELLNDDVQVLLLTHDQALWKNVQTAYQHKDLDVFLITIGEPAKGARIRTTSDTLDAMLARAEPFIGNLDPEIRKIAAERLRDATERFCKKLLFKHGQTQSLSDLDDKNLSWLIPRAESYLVHDPSHVGKLRAIVQRLNSGKHDDEIPTAGDLKVCFGDLRRFKSLYL